MYDMRDKRVLVVGLARSGMAVAQAALSQGAVISGYDIRPISDIDAQAQNIFKASGGRLFLGGEEPYENERWDLIVMSPGVPPDLPFLINAANNGAELIGEIELAWRLSKARFVAITGTNGKTTTTALTGEIFQNSGRTVRIVGNIGIPVISEVLDVSMDESAWLVTEVASLQLETINGFRPTISALLNITPDHLDRFHTMENYIAAKARIIENQQADDFFIINMDDPLAWALTGECKARVVPFSSKKALDYGAFIRDEWIVFKDEYGFITEFCMTGDLRILGRHNQENALAATAIAFTAGISAQVIGDTLKSFRGVEHRLEQVEIIKGVRYVNDSKGTNVDAAIKAIEATQPGIILIAGGYDKHATFDSFINAFQGKVKHLLLLGTTAQQIKSTALSMGFTQITLCENMKECVCLGYKLASPGDTVLLSPACASWDMYTCFEERGGDFKKCVAELDKME